MRRCPIAIPVICSRCGKGNPSHLIFCEECGHRLTPRPSATPPPPETPDAVRVPSKPPPQRPLAPDLNFFPRAEAPGSEDRVVCPLCGSRNQRSVRFCVTCGHLLAHAPTRPLESGEPKRSGQTAPPPPIAPMPVVDLSAPAPAASRARVCPQCQNLAEGPGQFCRFCGHSLAEAPPPAPAPAPSPVLAPAPPAPVRRSAAVGLTVPIPAPRAIRHRLVLIARDGREGPSFPVGDSTDIGRSEGDIVLADDRYVSPRHARVTLRGDAYFLRDLESTNGVFVRIPFSRGQNGPSGAGSGAADMGVSEQPLTDQDLFLVGQQVLRFEVVKHADHGFGVASENGTLLFGTPAAPRYARLTQRTVEGVVRDVFHVRKAEMVIGRESGDIVFTDDPFLSRRHAILRVQGLDPTSANGPTFGLSDLGSSNGTFLKIRDEVRLQPGTHFRIGQQLFRLDADTAGGGE